MTARHLYVHVPFCPARCAYCSFHSGPGTLEGQEAWLRQVIRQRQAADERWGPPDRIESLYLGGGSPTALPVAMLDRVLEAVVGDWPLAPDAELSVEVNPATLEPAHAAVMRARGVTRASLGAQSFDDRALRFLGRACGPAQVAAAVRILRDHGIPSVGLDLILGIPERESPWTRDIDSAVALAPDHLSAYLLSIEPGTPLARRRAAGAFQLLDDSAADDLLNAAERRLTASGFAQYEISNFARPGHACRHNLNTWLGGDYLGLGPSACSRIGHERLCNQPDGSISRETLESADDWTERILFMPRTVHGLDLDAFHAAHPGVPAALIEVWERRCRALRRHGLLRRVEGRWVTTRRGRRRADAIAEALLPD